MAERHGRQLKVGIAYQSAWASPKGTSDTYLIYPYDAGSVVPEPTVTVSQFNWYQSAGIMDAVGRNRVDSVNELQRIRFSGVACVERLAPHLAGALQSVTESAVVDVYDKDFTPADTVLDFSSDDGVLHTIAMENYNSGGGAGDGIILENAIIDDLTISVDNTASGIDNLMKISGSWVGNEMNDNLDLSGATFTAIPASPTFLPNATVAGNQTWTLNLTVGSNTFSDTCWRRFEYRVNNNVSSDCKKTAGKPNNYRIAPEIMVTIDIPYNENTYKVFASYKDGDNVAFDFSNGAATGQVGQIKFDAENGVLVGNPYEYEGDYHAIRVEAKLLRPAAGWNAAHIGFVDGVDYTY